MKPKRLVVVRFRQDRNKWEVDHPNPPGGGPARSRPLFATETEATEYAAKIAKRLEAGAPVGDGDPNMTLGAAFERYFLAKARKRSLAKDRRHAEHLKAAFGQHTRLKDVTAGRISAYRERRLAATSIRRKDAAGHPTPLSAASINRPLALLRHLLRLILLRAGRGAEWRQRDDEVRDETATRYHRASSGASGRIVSRRSNGDRRNAREAAEARRPGAC